jgi:dTDP-4-dehydrorhamnose 3,5-epimerase
MAHPVPWLRMKATPTKITDVFLLEPKVFGDERGFFFESFNQRAFEQATGWPTHCA